MHIGDRESDIYELFNECESQGTMFVFRTCANRRSGEGEETVAEVMENQRVKAVHRIEVRNSQGRPSSAVLELKYHRLQICLPDEKTKRYPNLTLTVIHAKERGQPKDRDPIHWKLITNLPVRNKAEVIEKLDWYSLRWKIETFHKVLKSGCREEDSKLRSAERLANLIAILCIVAWRVLWLTMVNRCSPTLPVQLVFTETEIHLLDHLIPMNDGSHGKTVGAYLTRLARLSGYLNRARDAPPGNMVLWRGMTRLTDIHLGFTLAQNVGN